MEKKQHTIESLEKEIAYYKKQLDRLSGNTISSQYAFAQLSNISKKYIRGFKIMADLQCPFNFYIRKEILYEEFMKGIFSQMFFDRVVLLEVVVGKKSMNPISSRGFNKEEKAKIDDVLINITEDFLQQKKSLLVSIKINTTDFEKLLQQRLLTQYFIFILLINNQ